MADPLYVGGYPALHDAANASSLHAQRTFLWALRVRLGGLMLGTVGGALLVSFDMPAFGGWTALIGFVAALGAELYLLSRKPDKAWYEGRAAAESAKTLAWRYAVKGESFEGGNEATVDREFLSRIGEVLQDLGDLRVVPGDGSTHQITEGMRSIRALPFDDRKSTYREGRLEDQRSWYSTKAQANGTAANRWTLVLFSAEVLGVIGGVLTITGVVALDLLAILAAVAATATGWMQAKQHETLATAYALTAQELASVKSELDALADESEWADFVGQAEEAISREHTLWRASRGVRLRPTRSEGRA